MANLSQQRREKMLNFLEKLKEQHSDDASLIAINQIEKELTSKKYGLVWEEHEEEVDVHGAEGKGCIHFQMANAHRLSLFLCFVKLYHSSGALASQRKLVMSQTMPVRAAPPQAHTGPLRSNFRHPSGT